MDKRENFKKFINNHPEILSYIKSKEMTMQSFYEIYDIYGEDSDIWNKYFKNDRFDKLGELTNLIKNVNLDNIEKYINNAGKAIGILQELSKKTPEVVTKVSKPVTSYFGD